MSNKVLTIRVGKTDDAEAIAEIYNQGIEDGTATFEVIPRTGEDIIKWFDHPHPVVVGEINNKIVGFASTSEYSNRECYKGIAECSLYVARNMRGKGIGTKIMASLIKEAETMGYWKLLGKIFLENTTSLTLVKKLGFRVVGIHEKHATINGVWKDVFLVELLIQSNIV